MISSSSKMWLEVVSLGLWTIFFARVLVARILTGLRKKRNHKGWESISLRETGSSRMLLKVLQALSGTLFPKKEAQTAPILHSQSITRKDTNHLHKSRSQMQPIQLLQLLAPGVVNTTTMTQAVFTKGLILELRWSTITSLLLHQVLLPTKQELMEPQEEHLFK